MPLGKISEKMIDEGYAVLQDINAELEQSSPDDAQLMKLSSKFFTVIPHNFGFKKLSDFIIKDTNTVKQKLEMVSYFLCLCYSYKSFKESYSFI